MSDRNTRAPRGLVIGTAGHIDHGKTALIRSLTGIDTDRLAEEKRRGISIDLGFAHLALADGRTVSFVDVPGHERFVKNMLAGAGGIQAVMLIVAADESVKPQTREHFEICRLLGLQHGLVVITKIDLASAQRVTQTRAEIVQLCANSFLANAPVIETSARTGAGLDLLKRNLSALMDRTPSLETNGSPRLYIDRSFALKGFGTVVTGTLRGGMLRTGETVELQPHKLVARIRGIEVHGGRTDVAVSGQRTAVNLTGLDHSEIKRGLVLTHAEGLESTRLIDASIDWLQGTELPKSRAQFLFHAGTVEVPAMLKVFKDDMYEPRFARIWFSEPVFLLPGDRFVLRRPSPAQSVAGGWVIDLFPPVRLNRRDAVARLAQLASADASKRLQILIEESRHGRHVSDLAKLLALSVIELRALASANPKLVVSEAAGYVVSWDWVERTGQNVLEMLRNFHVKNPALPGAPVALARMGLKPALASLVFANIPAIRVKGDAVSLATYEPQRNQADDTSLQRLEIEFRRAGLQPCAPIEILKAAGADPVKSRALLETLVKNQRLVRISENLIFHADVLLHVRKALAAHKGRKFSVPEFKDWTQVSRKFAIPLLEYLDRQRITRREGDSRVVL